MVELTSLDEDMLNIHVYMDILFLLRCFSLVFCSYCCMSMKKPSRIAYVSFRLCRGVFSTS